jgi:hypothetical protein
MSFTIIITVIAQLAQPRPNAPSAAPVRTSITVTADRTAPVETTEAPQVAFVHEQTPTSQRPLTTIGDLLQGGHSSAGHYPGPILTVSARVDRLSGFEPSGWR